MPRLVALGLGLFLLAPLVAQTDVRPDKPQGSTASGDAPPNTKSQLGKGGKGGKGAMTEVELKEAEAELANLSPEERLERTKIHGARGYCHIDVNVRPSRLMPGQSGVAIVTMIFEGDAVMPSPATVKLEAVGGAPQLTFGPMALDPARNGRLAKAYLGQPVYDNYAVIRVPVTMAANVPMGSKPQGSLEVTFDLFHGTTGTVIGRFADRANLAIEVGASPDPVVSGAVVAPTPTKGAGTEPAASTEPSRRPEAGSVAPNKAPAAAGQTLPVGASDPGQNPSSDSGAMPAVPADSGGSSVLLLAGGALAVLVIAVVLMRRR